MPDERFKPDANNKAGGVMGGYSSLDDIGEPNPTLIAFRVNPITGRLLVDATVSGTGVTDGEAVDADYYGILVLGTDGSNYQILKTDSDGHLQIDVLSGGGAGVQYTEADTDASITGTAMLMEVAGDALAPIQGTVAAGLLVNLGSNNDVTLATLPDTAGGDLADIETNTNSCAVVGAGAAATAQRVHLADEDLTALENITVISSGTVTNAGTFATQVDGSALTALQLIDNAVDGNYFNVNLNYAGTDAPTGAGTEAGVLRVTIATDSTGVLSIDDNGGAITVDGTVTANLSTTDNAVLDAIALGFGTEGDALADGVLIQGDDGTDRTNVLVDTSGHLQVDVLTAPAVRALTNADVVTAELSATDNAVLDAVVATLGATSGAAVVTDANGTIQQYLRGLVTLDLVDNAVLDTIDAAIDAINAKLVTGTVIGDVNLGATDNAVLDAAVTALQLIDNPIDGNYFNVNLNVAGTDATSGAGAEANTLRVTIANDSTGLLSVDDNAGSLTVDNTSIDGPGKPTIDSYQHLAINLAAGANQVLVSSAANKQIWVYGVSFVCSVAGTVSFQDEDDLAISGIMPFAANSGFAIPPSGNFAMPIWKLATNKDLEVDVVTCDIDGFLDYAIVSV